MIVANNKLTNLIILFITLSYNPIYSQSFLLKRTYRAWDKQNIPKVNKLINKLAQKKRTSIETITFDYIKTKFNIDSNKSDLAKERVKNALKLLSKLNPQEKSKSKFLEKDFIDFQEIIAENEPAAIIDSYVDTIPTFSEDQTNKANSYIQDDPETRAESILKQIKIEANKQHIVIPEIFDFKVRRQGPNKNDLLISCKYGSRDDAVIQMACFNRGVWSSENSENALKILNAIIRNFIDEEKPSLLDCRVDIVGTADAIHVGNLLYNESEKISDVIYKKTSKGFDPQPITITPNKSISNDILAFLRGYKAKLHIQQIPELSNIPFRIFSNSYSSDTGNAYRTVSIDIYIKNAYKIKLQELDSSVKAFTFETIRHGEKSIESRQSNMGTSGRSVIEDSSVVRRAIVFGISDYKNFKSPPDCSPPCDLLYAKKDAIDVAKLFSPKYQRLVGTWEVSSPLTDKDATKSKIQTLIKSVLDVSDENDEVLIYFSGHGAVDANDNYYLLPYDFKPDNYNTAILGSDIVDMIAACKSNKIMCFIDACKSGKLTFGGKDAAAKPGWEKIWDEKTAKYTAH